MTKYCKSKKCGKLLVRHEKETKANWERRKTCDYKCSIDYRKENFLGFHAGY